MKRQERVGVQPSLLLSADRRGGKCTCGKIFLRGWGNWRAPIVICGFQPAQDDIKYNLHWSDEEGNVLRQELQIAGVSLDRCYMTNLWQHAPYERCGLGVQIDNLLSLLADHKLGVIFVGSELSNLITGKPATTVSGIDLIRNNLLQTVLPENIKAAVVVPSVKSIMYGAVGEMRFALQAFRQLIK